MEIKRIILSGKAASGKDHARKILEGLGFNYGISYTTRPPRDVEVNGVDYHFLSRKEFDVMISRKEWYEYVDFNGWSYGTTNEQFHGSCDTFIMTPHGISEIKEKDRDDCLILFFDIDDESRRERLVGRNDSDDKMERRMEADTKDFSDFTDWDVKISDPLFDLVNDILNPAIEKQIPFNEHIITKINNYEY